jgi:hypothetical protein
VADVVSYLKAVGLDKDLRPVAEQMLPLIRHHGNLRVLDDAVEEARAEADADDGALTARLVHEAVCDLCKMPRPGREEDQK